MSEQETGKLWIADLSMLAVAAWASPLQVWANNPVGVNHPERLLLLGLFPWLLSVAIYTWARHRGVRVGTVTVPSFVALIVVMRGRFLAETFGLYGAIGLAVFLVFALGYLVSRRMSHALMRPILVVGTVTLAVAPVQSLISARASMGVDVAIHGADEIALDLALRPDVFIIVADGYAGKLVFESDFGVDEPVWATELARRGFQVPSRSWASYPTTQASIPALLDMSYPLMPGRGIEPATSRTLYEMIGGDNRLVRLLADRGYRLTMIESGWSGSSCGVAVDDCVDAPFLDEATFWAIHRTIVGPSVLHRFGYSFTQGAVSAMTWMSQNAGPVSSNGVPDLVLAHVMVPHPPFFLDEDCEVRYSPSLSGVTFLGGGGDDESRRNAYLAQSRCVDSFFIDMAEAIDREALVVLVADHGTDMRGQLAKPADTWDEEALIERMNVLLAVRTKGNCGIGGATVLPNVMRRALSCYSSSRIEDLPSRMFVYSPVRVNGLPTPIIPLDHDLVAGFLEVTG